MEFTLEGECELWVFLWQSSHEKDAGPPLPLTILSLSGIASVPMVKTWRPVIWTMSLWTIQYLAQYNLYLRKETKSKPSWEQNIWWLNEQEKWTVPLAWDGSRCFNAGIERGLHTVVSTTAQLDFNGCSMGQSFKPLAASCFDLGKWLQLMWDLSTGHWLSRERQGWLLSVKKAEKSYRPQTKNETMQGTYSRAKGTELPCRGKGTPASSHWCAPWTAPHGPC